MGSPGFQMATGGAMGTGAKIEVRGLGFKPRFVNLCNLTSDDEGYWYAPMTEGTVYKRLKAGGGEHITTTANGIVPQADGFDIGVDADINASGEPIAWIAYS